VNFIAFSPNNNTLTSASEDQTVKTWIIATGQVVRSIATGGANSFVAYNPTGDSLAVVTYRGGSSQDNELSIWAAPTGVKQRSYSYQGYWSSVAITPDWRYLAVFAGQKISIGELQTGQFNRTEDVNGYEFSLMFSPDGRTLGITGTDTLSLWSFLDATGIQTLPNNSLAFSTGLSVNQDNQHIAWGSGNRIYVWDRTSLKPPTVLQGNEDWINEVAFSPDGRLLASSTNSTVKLWSTSNWAWMGDLSLPQPDNIEQGWNGSQSVAFSPDGKLIATAEQKVTRPNNSYKVTLGIRIWEVASRRLVRFFQIPDLPSSVMNHRRRFFGIPNWVRSLAFSPDGKYLAADNGRSNLLVWDLRTRRMRTFGGNESEINSVAFSPNSKRIVTANFDSTVKIWDVPTGRLLRTLAGHQDRVATVKFSPNGQAIVSGSADRTLRLWDANTGRLMSTLADHESAVTSVGFSTDGQVLFSTSIDGKVDLWSVSDQSLRATMAAGADNSWVCFSPEGFYAGNDAEKYLAWRVGNEIYQGEYRVQFAQPRALSAKLNGLTPTTSTLSVTPPTDRSGDVRAQSPSGSIGKAPLYEHSYALLLGNSDYLNNEVWKDLPGVRVDLREVKQALEAQGFSVVSFDDQGKPRLGKEAIDLTRDRFYYQVEQFISTFGQDEDNRLLIYFAGHGYTALLRDKRKMGYLMMQDAPVLPSVSEALENPLSNQQIGALHRSSINMDEIETWAKNIKARHALFVFDSCFAGSVLFRGVDAPPPDYVTELVAEPVREFLTAGNELQVVPDDSIFRKAFVRGIQGAADAADRDHPKDGYVLASELYAYILKEVTYFSDRKQTPVFGKIFKQELAKGDFVFIYNRRP
jgi:WD40 repeat protein